MSINLSNLKFFFFNNFVLFLNMFLFLFMFINFTLTSSLDIAFADELTSTQVAISEGSLKDNDIYSHGLGRELLENFARLDGANPDDPVYRLQLENESRYFREVTNKIIYDPSRKATELEIEELLETYAIACADTFAIEAARKSNNFFNLDLIAQNYSIQSSLIYFYPDCFLLLLVIFLIVLNLFFKKYLLSFDIVNFNIYISLIGIFFTIFLL